MTSSPTFDSYIRELAKRCECTGDVSCFFCRVSGELMALQSRLRLAEFAARLNAETIARMRRMGKKATT